MGVASAIYSQYGDEEETVVLHVQFPGRSQAKIYRKDFPQQRICELFCLCMIFQIRTRALGRLMSDSKVLCKLPNKRSGFLELQNYLVEF